MRKHLPVFFGQALLPSVGSPTANNNLIDWIATSCGDRMLVHENQFVHTVQALATLSGGLCHGIETGSRAPIPTVPLRTMGRCLHPLA